MRPGPAVFEPPPPGGGRPHVFTLRLSHVVKSQSRAQVGEEREVYFVAEEEVPPPLGRQRIGSLPVRVATGDLVIVYADPREYMGRVLLVPVWGGFSVVRLTPPPSPGEAIRR